MNKTHANKKHKIRIKPSSTRPVVTFPFIIDQNDDVDMQKIAQGLYIVRYLTSEIPGIEVIIRKITTTDITLSYKYYDQNGTKMESAYDGYRIGFNILSDGVLYATGRKFKPTFAEFVQHIREQHFYVDGNINTSEEDVSSSSQG